MRNSVLTVAVLAIPAVALGVIGIVNAPPRQPVPAIVPDVALPRWQVGGSATDRSTAVLHVALLGFSAGEEVVLDAARAYVTPDSEVELDLGFRTPQQLQGRRPFGILGRSFGGSGDHWRSRIRQSRPLPPSFGHLELHLEMKGLYLGQRDGRHALRVDELEGHHYSWHGGSGGGGTLHLPCDDLLMLAEQPVARVYLRRGLALLLMLVPGNGEKEFATGRQQAWREAFRAAVDRYPAVDDEMRFAPVEDSEPGTPARWSPERYEPLVHGSVVDLLAAAFVLQDMDGIRQAVSRLREPGVLERAFEGAARDPAAPLADWYEEHIDGPWRRLVTSLVRGEAATIDFQNDAWTLRLVGLTDDAAVAAKAVDSLFGQRRQEQVRRFVLEQEEWGQTASVREQFERLRGAVIADLPLPWKFVLRSPWLLLAWCLLAPVLAALVAWRVRPNGGAVSFEFVATQALLFAVFSFVTICEFPLRTLLVPVWWWLAIRWLRVPVAHGVVERGLLWLALSLASIDGLHNVSWFVTHPAIQYASTSGLLFCWCLVGLWIAHDGRWRQPQSFVVFLWCGLALQVISIFFADGENPFLEVPVFVLAVISYLVFLSGGRQRAAGG